MDSGARSTCAKTWPDLWVPELVAHLTMTHGLFPNNVLPYAWVSFLGSAWSLSTEWQFYILSLIIVGAGSRRLGTDPANTTRLGWDLLLLAACGVAWNWTTPESWQFSRAFLGNEAHFFALGVASVAVVREQRGALPIYGATLVITLAICALQGSFGKLVPPLLWTVCLAAQMRPGVVGLRQLATMLRCRTAQYLGAISYCVYLANEPIHKLLALTLSRLADGNAAVFTAVWLPSAILLPLLASDWLHRHVEMPALRWGRAAAGAWSTTHPRLAEH
jgi:peptidoglycan/LPS O-acetylase OafA/YrhL